MKWDMSHWNQRSGTVFEIGIGIALGLGLILLSAAAAWAANRGRDPSAGWEIAGLLVLGLAFGVVAIGHARSPFVNLSAFVTLWVAIATSPVLAFGLPDWATFDLRIGDIGVLIALSGVLAGFTVRHLSRSRPRRN